MQLGSLGKHPCPPYMYLSHQRLDIWRCTPNKNIYMYFEFYVVEYIQKSSHRMSRPSRSVLCQRDVKFEEWKEQSQALCGLLFLMLKHWLNIKFEHGLVTCRCQRCQGLLKLLMTNQYNGGGSTWAETNGSGVNGLIIILMHSPLTRWPLVE